MVFFCSEFCFHKQLCVIAEKQGQSIVTLHCWGCCRISFRNDPKAPSFSSLVAGIHARFRSLVVAASFRPPGANSDVKRVHISSAPVKNAIKNSFRYGRSRSLMDLKMSECCHSSPPRQAVTGEGFLQRSLEGLMIMNWICVETF